VFDRNMRRPQDGAWNDGLLSREKYEINEKRFCPVGLFRYIRLFRKRCMGKYVDMANDVMGIKPENRGRWVEFDSPLFGRCFGRIREVKANLYHITDHSVLKTEVTIPGT